MMRGLNDLNHFDSLSFIIIYVICMITLHCKVNEKKNMFGSAISDFYCDFYYDTLAIQIQTITNLQLHKSGFATAHVDFTTVQKGVQLHVGKSPAKYMHCMVLVCKADIYVCFPVSFFV